MALPFQRTIPRILPHAQSRPILHPPCTLARTTYTERRALPAIKSLSAYSTTRAVYSDKNVPASRPGPDVKSTGPSRDGTVGSRSGSAGFDTELPVVSFESLGIGRNMKLFLLVVLGVFGSIETWFWCKAIWIWWKKGDIDVENGSQ